MADKNLFTNQEYQRYARHIAIPEFNIEGQKALKNGSVLCVGAGGLGSPMLLYLAAAGVGHIGIVDADRVEDSNLQRQVLYTTNDIGKSKAETAKKRLLDLNPFIKITSHPVRLTSENALDIISQYDVIADGTDNFPTRYLINDACVLCGKPNVYAAISRFEGQVSVFNLERETGERGPNYRDLFPQPPAPGTVQNCEEAGVLGVLPGIIGSLQANEVIKVLTGIGTPLDGRFFIMDALEFSTHILKIAKNKNTIIDKLIDYEGFCGWKKELEIKEISYLELTKMQEENEDFQLIDVREKEEYDLKNLGGLLLPLSSILENKDRIATDKKVIIHCESGQRSAQAIRLLEENGDFENLYNLQGGIREFVK